MRNALTIPRLLLFFVASSLPGDQHWLKKKTKHYDVYYASADKHAIKEYRALLSHAVKDVEGFFDTSFKKRFDVYIHPGRASLDSTWSKDWSSPGFKSECWMVASGVAARMDILSPNAWATQACEHVFANKKHTQQLVTHEFFHVFHGQLNPSGDFSNTENIDWFVEGLATYASGQCDSAKLSEVNKAIAAKTIPAILDKFWTGKLKYGLSGSVVMYIDRKYGRAILKELLKYTRKQQLFDALNVTEENFVRGWYDYMAKFTSPERYTIQ